MSAIASRAGSTRNKLLWGELLIGLACGTVAMVQDISPFYKESIHAGDGWEPVLRLFVLSSAFLITSISLTVAKPLYKP